SQSTEPGSWQKIPPGDDGPRHRIGPPRRDKANSRSDCRRKNSGRRWCQSLQSNSPLCDDQPVSEEQQMPRVRDILEKKGDHVWTIGKSAKVLDAALLMNEHKIGALVVLDQGDVVGMFTERDVLVRVVAERRDPATTHVADVMTVEVFCCTPETPLDEAKAAM